MLITVLKTSEQTPPTQEAIAEPQLSFTAYAQTTTGEDYCISPLNIESQIPFWIKQNYSNDETNNYFVDFIKEYYNWLYCGFKKENINLTPYDIEDLLNVDTVPDEFLNLYVKTYAPFISIASIQETDRQNLRKFLRSIKTDFLISKGTEGSYRYLLKILFNVNNVIIDYPKKYLMRLNGGKYIDFSWDLVPNSIIDLPDNFNQNTPIQDGILAGNVGYDSFNRPNLFGSALNESILPDDNFWQEHSYILTSDASVSDAINYKNTVLSATHPAGTIGFFEQYISVGEIDIPGDQPTGGVPVSVNYSENPVIGRYLLYSPSINTNPQNDYATTFYESYSIGSCVDSQGYICWCCLYNCNPSGSTGATGPQHYFPSWDPDIKAEIEDGGTLGHMTIQNFLELRQQNPNAVSPNSILSTCESVNSNIVLCETC